MIPEVPLVTVRVNGGPHYPFNLWAASAGLGIAGELNIDLDITSQGTFATAALKRGEFDIVASCPACAFGVYEAIPEFRNFLTTYQWRGFQIIGREVDGVPVHKTWSDFFAEADGDLAAANAAFAQSVKGKSFAIWEVSSLPTLEALLKQGGLTTDDVVVIDFADITIASTAFINGTGDYNIGDSESVSRMLTGPDLKDKFVVAAPFQAFGPAGLWYSTFASTEQWLADNEETALRLLAIWYRTTRYLYDRTDDVLPHLHEAVRRAGGIIVDDDAVKQELFNVEDFVRFQDAWDHYYADGSPTNMDLSIQLSYDNAVALEHIPAESDWRTFEVEEAWFLKLLDRPDLVAWIQSPLS
jgi:ABC-type nitrate/sulfonate/bicarbonate transport system substrate-binding protein